MADPVPSLDELVEVGAKTAFPDAFVEVAGHSDAECPDCKWNRDDARLRARSIITAVLPRVVGAAVEASKVFADVADDYDDTEDDDLQVLVDTDFLAPRLRLRSFRRARTVSDQLRALGGG